MKPKTDFTDTDGFDLINMNGRMYDPFLARFLSPDPFIKDATDTQSLNRFSYVLNNPLIYTDPSGYTYKPDDWDEKAVTINPYFSGGPTGAVGPGSGNHWSDQYRSPVGNFMLGNHSTVDGKYGNGAFDFLAGVYSGDIPTYTWNPIAGKEVYRETNGSFVNIYHSGDWTLSKPNLGAINGGDNLFGMAANSRVELANDGISSQEVAYVLTALGLSVSRKTELFRVLEGSKNLPKYFEWSSKFGMRLGFVGLGVTTLDGFTNPNGWQNHHTADLLIQGGMLTTAAFLPGVGWILAGGYFVSDLIFQHYHDGQGITEYYFDKP